MTLDTLKGTIIGVSKMIAASDAIKCYQYAEVLYLHLKDFVMFFIADFGFALENLLLAVHKSPVAMYQCYYVLDDSLGFNHTV